MITVRRIFGNRLGFVLLVFCLLSCRHGYAAATSTNTNKSLSDLEREAKEVLLLPDNVDQRRRVQPLFDFAEECAAQGKVDTALRYYQQGLERYPWNLKAQLALAALYQSRGESNAVQQKAELVWNHAETDAELAKAAGLLGRRFSTNLIEDAFPTNGCALALVRCQGAQAWLMQSLREDLQGILEIPVVFRSAHFTWPKPQRDPVHKRAEELRERIRQMKKDPQFQLFYITHRLGANGLDEDEEVFKAVEKILKADTNAQQQVRMFNDGLAFLRRLGQQWDSGELATLLSKDVNATPGSRVGYLGVTQMDLFADQNNFVFGVAGIGANCAIISCFRYTSALTEEPPNKDRLRQRALKQALSSVGLLFGIPRCSDPTCARAYANSLSEHDAKQPKVCDTCKKGFRERFLKAES